MTLDCGFQGQPRSNIMTDLNSQHVVSCLLLMQTVAQSVTVFEIFNIFVCMGDPIPTPNFGCFGIKDPQIATVEISNPQKGVCYADPRLLSHFGTSSTFRLVCGPVKEVVYENG